MNVFSYGPSFYYEADRTARRTSLNSDQNAKTVRGNHEKLLKDTLSERQSIEGCTGNDNPFTKDLQKLQHIRVTDADHSAHPRELPAKGVAEGNSGGVSCGIDYIEGLFDHPEAIFEHNHVFCFPALPNGEIPCTDVELQQILRELAIGLYEHNTVPEFTLGINQNADHFPKIHPVFENTLVGRVICMLSYMMKGYLDGGIFMEGFIDEWHVNSDWKTKNDSAMQNLIDFTEYCRKNLSGEDKNYKSFRVFQKEFEDSSKLVQGEEPALSSYESFKSSFQIISKQNSIKKEGNVFLIDADFDVKYTLNSPPEYAAAFKEHFRRHGTLPASYVAMEKFYKFFCKRLHDHMTKLPIFRKYFAMLPLIDFFLRYFFTLKKNHKVPVLPKMHSTVLKGCPPLFPYLPISSRIEESLQYDMQAMLKGINPQNLTAFDAYCRQLHAHFLMNSARPMEKKELFAIIEAEIQNSIINSASLQVRRIVSKKIESSKEIQDEISRSANDFFEKIETVMKESAKNLFKNLLQQIFDKVTDEAAKKIVMDAYEANRSAFEKFFFQMYKDLLIPTNKENSDGEISYALSDFIFKNIPKPKVSELRDLLEMLRKSCKSVVEDITSCVASMSKIDKPKVVFHMLITEVCLKSEMQLDEIEKGIQLITGCSVHLQKQAIQTSEIVLNILRSCWAKFQKIQSETWTEISFGPTQSKSFAFRLAYEDVPAWIRDDYAWMKSYLFVPNNKDSVENEERHPYPHIASDSFVALTPHSVGPNIYVRDHRGMLPIHYASLHGQTETVKAMLAMQKKLLNAAVERSIKQDSKLASEAEERAMNYFEGATPLLLAVENNHIGTIQFLLQQQADTEVQTKQGLNVLSLIASKGTKATLDMFLPYKLSRDPKKICQAIAHAIARDNVDIVIPLYERGFPINVDVMDGFTGIQLAAKYGALSSTQWLLQQGADPLLPGPTGEDALQLSAANRSWKQFSLILEFIKPKLDELRHGRETLLHTASKSGKLMHVMSLISCSALINIKDHRGNLPIHLATHGGHASVARMLLACGADSSVKTADGKALHELIPLNDKAMHNAFQEYMVALEESEKMQDSQLHFAVRCQDPQAVLLQTRLVKVDIVNGKGETALHIAVELNQEKSCLHLLQAGANPNVKSSAGRTPVEIARTKKLTLIELLMNTDPEK